jgi:putative oxidoreductase
MSNTNNIIVLIARILLSFMFLFAGFGKVTDPAATAGMIAGAGLPAASALTYLAGTFELIMGLSVLVGYQVRYTGWLIALFCVFTGFVFHLPTVNVPDFPAAANGWINGLNFVNFLKNLTLAGAYIMLAIHGAGAYSIDARLGHAGRAVTA